jgi:hypothetical protein
VNRDAATGQFAVSLFHCRRQLFVDAYFSLLRRPAHVKEQKILVFCVFEFYWLAPVEANQSQPVPVSLNVGKKSILTLFL